MNSLHYVKQTKSEGNDILKYLFDELTLCQIKSPDRFSFIIYLFIFNFYEKVVWYKSTEFKKALMLPQFSKKVLLRKKIWLAMESPLLNRVNMAAMKPKL